MANDWQYAALSELVYRRNQLDQELRLSDINSNYLFVDNEALQFDPIEFSADQGVFFYNDSGFEAAVVQDGSDFIIVFRGTDTAPDTEEIIAASLTGIEAVAGPDSNLLH